MSRSIFGAMGKIPPNITCRQFEEFVNDYIDGSLPLIKRVKVGLHLMMCRDCKSYISAYRKSIELGKAFFDNPDSEVPEDMPEELISIILENMKNK